MIHGEAIFPALEPLPLKDVDGMGMAAIQLLNTLDPGINEPLVQYSTAKGVSTAMASLWEVSVQSKEETVSMVLEMKKSCVASNPITKSQWYKRFLNGMHKIIGGSVKQAEVSMSIEQMIALMEEFEEDWNRVMKEKTRRLAQVQEVLFPALFVVISFCGALRGEEVPLMDLEATREFTMSGLEHTKEEKKHVVIALHGRFKNELGERFHLMPVVSDKLGAQACYMDATNAQMV
jgi:hypothetical protein